MERQDRIMLIGSIIAVIGLVSFALGIITLHATVSTGAAGATAALGGIVIMAVGIKTLLRET